MQKVFCKKTTRSYPQKKFVQTKKNLKSFKKKQCKSNLQKKIKHRFKKRIAKPFAKKTARKKSNVV
jgi:hypothetical protein